MSSLQPRKAVGECAARGRDCRGDSQGWWPEPGLSEGDGFLFSERRRQSCCLSRNAKGYLHLVHQAFGGLRSRLRCSDSVLAAALCSLLHARGKSEQI